MKISQISYLNTSKIPFNKTNEIQKSQIPLVQTNPSETFRYYMGRDIVSFKANPFNETLKKNYFKLPPQFSPDVFQIDAAKALNDNKNVLVVAPTGTGKTAIARYVTSKNMEEGKTTFYTTPLKALSNQKLNEFREIYGEENVGILTGDRRENIEAPIIIMTTEVYRNMALSEKNGSKNPLMKDLGTVIFDEFHYMGDDSRGRVWEESVMLTPKDVQKLELSATVGNPLDLINWQKSLGFDNTELVLMPDSARAVPLEFDSITTKSYEKNKNAILKSIERTGTREEIQKASNFPTISSNDCIQAVEKLSDKNQLPAILFIFSRRFSRELLENFAQDGRDLTSDSEKEEIEKIVNKYKSKGYIGSDLNIEALKKGYAIHNAGIIPAQKELIEELFQKKLTKVVISTETLAAGINMPAKTVVISSSTKPTDDAEERTRTLTVNEFKQMAGRAGRRGIDTIGYVYTMPYDEESEETFIFLEVADSNELKSKYEPEYAFLSGYFDNKGDKTDLNDFLAKSFRTYSQDEAIHKENLDKLKFISNGKTRVLVQHGFLNVLENGQYEPTILSKMASQLRGYDTYAIAITEAIAGKSFANITPEALVSVACAIANPDKYQQGNLAITEVGNKAPYAMTSEEALASIVSVITNSSKPQKGNTAQAPDLNTMINATEKNLQDLKQSICTSVEKKFKKLGTDFGYFKDYDEMLKNMLECAQSLIKPDASVEEAEAELLEATQKRQKMYTITKTTGKMDFEAIMRSIIDGETVPSKVLEDALDAVEKYKKRINARDIDTYIEKQRAQLTQIYTEGKGKKAKARLDRQRDEIKANIAQAQTMLYLEENAAAALNENYKFIRNNPPSKVKKEFEAAEKKYTKLTAKDELINEIKALISIEEYERIHENISKENTENANMINKCLKEILTKDLGVLSTEMKENLGRQSLRMNNGLSKTKAGILYNWAFMNTVSSDGISNWKQLLKLLPAGADEGSTYRYVLQTADFLGQIADMANVGYQNSNNEEDLRYYLNLRNTAYKARNLIIKYPIEV